ncbi:DUF6314 family protein [Arthrobacter agilis]|uniref:DUF6314 family protein n=1 Tax=Arthrobacter agilis TaxID=37921 RepID=UPI003621C3F1
MNDAARHGITDPLGFLAGSWTAQRRLLDRAAGVAGTFAGTTTFTPDHEEGLQWAEQGTVRWPSFEGPASRSYRVLRTTGAAIEVRFEDGRCSAAWISRPEEPATSTRATRTPTGWISPSGAVIASSTAGT